MKTFDGYEKRNLTDKDYALLAGGGHKALDTLFSALSSDTTNAIKITVGGTEKSITTDTLKTSLGLGSNAYTSTAYLPLAGGTMTGSITINGMYTHLNWNVDYLGGWARSFIAYNQHNSSSGDLVEVFHLGGYGNTNGFEYAYIGTYGYDGNNLRFNKNGTITIGSGTIWHSNNDGSGSGLDADLLDGIHANGLFTAFSNAGSQTTRITIGGVTKDLKIDADTVDNKQASYFLNRDDSFGGANLLPNATNEYLAGHLNIYSSTSSVSYSDEKTFEGQKTIKITNSANALGGAYISYSGVVLEKGIPYCYSFWIYSLIDRQVTSSTQTPGHTQTYNSASTVGDKAHNETFLFNINSVKANTWTRVYISFIPTMQTSFASFFLGVYQSTIYISDVKLEKGTYPTSWEPSYKDYLRSAEIAAWAKKSSLAVSDVPILNQNTTGTAAGLSVTHYAANLPISTTAKYGQILWLDTLKFSGIGTSTYNQAAMWQDKKGDFYLETSRASDSSSAIAGAFRVCTRGGQFTNLYAANIYSNNTQVSVIGHTHHAEDCDGCKINLFPKTSVSDGIGMLQNYSGTVSMSSTVQYEGQDTIKIIPSSSNVNTGASSNHIVNLKKGVTYCYSCYIYSTIADTFTTSSLGHFQTVSSTAAHNRTILHEGDSIPVNKWTRVYITFKPTVDDVSFRSFFIYFASTSQVIYITRIKLEQGEYPTQWCPSIFDYTMPNATNATNATNLTGNPSLSFTAATSSSAGSILTVTAGNKTSSAVTIGKVREAFNSDTSNLAKALTLTVDTTNKDTFINFTDPGKTVKLGIKRPLATYGPTYYDGTNYYKLYHDGYKPSADDASKLGGNAPSYYMNTTYRFGGQNLLKGSHITTNNWITYGGGTITESSSITFQNHNTLRITAGGAYNAFGSVPLQAGVTYCYSCWIYSNIADNWGWNSLGHFQTKNSQGSDINHNGTRGHQDNPIKANTWTYVWQTFTPQYDSTFYGFFIYFENSSQVIYVSDIKLEMGNYPTYYQPDFLPISGGTLIGNLTAPAFFASSDIRLKKNIINESKSIRSFRWKDSNEKSYGLIAQEIENEYPELVSNNDNGYKSINYTSALCMIIAKLENTVDTLRERIEYLEQNSQNSN